jgi:Bacterial antitoxin of type II TA system, VapB
MGTHMKTTIEISDSLLEEARRVARERRTTLRAILEAALRRELAARSAPPKKFKLRDGSFRGAAGVQPGIDLSDWSQIRRIIYEGRGE